MFRFVVRRLLQAIPVLFVIVTISFAEVVRPQQRFAEPLINLRELGAVDERRLPRGGSLPVVPRGGKRGGHEGERRRGVDVRLDRLLEAGYRRQ